MSEKLIVFIVLGSSFSSIHHGPEKDSFTGSKTDSAVMAVAVLAHICKTPLVARSKD